MVSFGDFRANRWVTVRTLDTVNHFHAPSDSTSIDRLCTSTHILDKSIYIWIITSTYRVVHGHNPSSFLHQPTHAGAYSNTHAYTPHPYSLIRQSPC